MRMLSKAVPWRASWAINRPGMRAISRGLGGIKRVDVQVQQATVSCMQYIWCWKEVREVKWCPFWCARAKYLHR